MKDFNLDEMSDEELKQALEESSFPEEEKLNSDDDDSSSNIEIKDIEDTKELSREEKRQRQAELKVQRKNDRELYKQRKKNRKEAIKNNIEVKRIEAPYYIALASALSAGKNVTIAAQDVYPKAEGAFTGMVGGQMLADRKSVV